MRMIGQLVSVAILYMAVYIPSCALLLLGTFLPNNQGAVWANMIRDQYFLHLKYLVFFLCPFVVLAGQTEMHEHIKGLFRSARRPQQTATIMPITAMLSHFLHLNVHREYHRSMHI